VVDVTRIFTQSIRASHRLNRLFGLERCCLAQRKDEGVVMESVGGRNGGGGQ
jgi:hypothetical protein